MMEYSILQRLPDNGQKCLCFGHETVCCKEDMEEKAAWHEVTFKLFISSLGLKKEMPEDPEETILRCYTVVEIWELGENSWDGHVIGVTKWKTIEE